MIQAAAQLDPPVPRLLAALGDRADAQSTTVVLGSGPASDGFDTRADDARILVMSALGAHPDARAKRLRALWAMEERARASGRPVLVLRLAPIVGPASPLWLRLRSRPALPASGRLLLNPVAEGDVIETLVRALDGRAAWDGWYEVAGAEVFALDELAGLAARAPETPRGAGDWEPAPEEWGEHRLAEAGPWSEHFGFTPTRISDRAESWP